MAEDVQPLDLRKLQRKGTLQSVLDWMGRPGTATLDLLTGHAGGAAREGADFLLGPARALTGDLIPELSKPEDERTLASVAGVTDPGWKKTGLDLAGAALNPLTYVGFGKGKGVRFMGKTVAAEGKTVDPLTLMGKGATKLISKLPEKAQEKVQGIKQGIKNTMGWHDISNANRDLLGQAAAMRSNVSRAGLTEVKRLMQEHSLPERKAMFHVLTNAVPKDGKWETLGGGTLEQRLARHPLEEASKAKVAETLKGVQKLTAGQMQELKDLQIYDKNAVGADDYIQRSYTGLPSDPEKDILGGTPSALKHRTLRSGEEFADFMNANPDVKVEEDAAQALSRRADQQGRLAQRATLAKGMLKESYTHLADPKTRQGVEHIITTLEKSDPDLYHSLNTAYNGMKPQTGVLGVLAKANRLFKPAAVYGIVFPRISSIVRNTLAFPTQVGSVEGIPASVALNQVKNIGPNILGAIDDGVTKAFGTRMYKGSHLSQDMDLIEKAFQSSGGVAAYARKFLLSGPKPRQDLVYALDHGVLDDFVSSEKMMDGLTGGGMARKVMTKVGLSRKTQQKILDIAEAPAASFAGTEQRAKLTVFKELMEAHKMPVEEAARHTKDSFYEYGAVAPANRTLRTLIPFAAFATNAMRQQGKWLSRVPAVGTVAGAVYGQGNNDTPVYPYLSGQAHVGIGRNAQGDSQYLTGFGMPIEALNQIPNLTGGAAGDELLRTGVGSAQPLLKSAVSFVTGKDPYFQTPYGSYDKAPAALRALGAGESGTAGRLYNELEGTGLIQPFANPINQLDQLLDPRMGSGTKAVNMLTGSRVVTVDENKALQQILDRYLQTLPSVQKSTHLYQRSKDPETQQVLHQLDAAKKKISDRRKAEMAGDAAAAPTSTLRM